MHDLKNKTFGYWTALEPVKKNNRKYWRCRCICGNENLVRTSNLTQGVSNSCGCVRYEIRSEKRRSYTDYLAVKMAVILEDATVNYVKEQLNVSLFIARCLVKDWKEGSEGEIENAH